ncbi:MATE family efflux transporter [Lacticaseibacillus jixiensis]|uniref:MATE family efflux transporter n=1 Tax=Lacticaseibacillus jixiensis TaxID=3231926 RepID=UPI0036F1C898
MQKFLTRWFSGESIDYRFVFALVGPVVADQFFLVTFNFLNTAMISNSGQSAISAVNLVGSINVLLIQVFVAVGLGGTVLISQYFGNKELHMLSKVVNGTVFGTVLAAICLSLIFGVLHVPILRLLFGAAEPAVMANAKLYMLGVLCSYPFEATVEGTNGCLRGIGRTKNSLILSSTMNGLYLLFNILFITVLHLGVVGMIISLNLSRWLASGFAVWMLISHRDLFRLKLASMRHIEWGMIKKVLLVAVPFAAESFFFSGGKIIIQMMIVGLGTSVIVTNAIAGSWTQLSEIIPAALQTALVPIVGQCIGRRNVQDARKLTKSFLGLAICAFVLVDGILFLSFHKGILLFSPAKAIIPDIFHIYIVFAIMHILVWSFSFVQPSALRAAGDGKFTTIVSLLSMWLFRVVGGYIVGIRLGYGLIGITVIMTIEWAIRGAIFTWRFHGTRWLQNRLI